MRDLYYSDAELAPTFDDVLERIQEHRELLVVVAKSSRPLGSLDVTPRTDWLGAPALEFC